MEFTLARAVIFIALVAVTFVLCYLYQRRERTQRTGAVWMYPAIFTLLAARAVFYQLPRDPGLLPWLGVAFLLGIPIGIARGMAFGVKPGDAPGEIRLRPNVLSFTIFFLVFAFNEFEHVFRFGDPNVARFSCAFLVLTVGNSLAVNLTRLFRYRAMTPKG